MLYHFPVNWELAIGFIVKEILVNKNLRIYNSNPRLYQNSNKKMLILIQGDFPYRMCCKSTKYTIEKSSIFERFFITS
jgi:hypothetical protein